MGKNPDVECRKVGRERWETETGRRTERNEINVENDGGMMVYWEKGE